MKKYLIFFVLISTCILIFSCNKEQNGNFTVSGYYYTADSVPIINEKVFIFYQRSTYPINLKSDMSKDVGEGYTDTFGYFEFNCEYYIGGRYQFNDRSSLGYVFTPKRDEHIHLDTLYSY